MSEARLSEVLGALPEELLPWVLALRAAAEEREVGLYLVGGPVRDWLLGRSLRDVDLLVDPGNRAREVVEAAALDDVKVEVHERFGTLSLSRGGARVDVAGARREHYPRPGALPQVESARIAEDLARRDFSVNALALRLDGVARGAPVEIVDPEGGRADLDARVLRVLHPRSFHDDPTRALRAARLAPRLGFHLSRGTRHALRAALRDGAFGAVSGERLRRELEHLFADTALGLAPGEALRRLEDWHVLGALEPGLGLPRAAAAPLRRLGRALADPPWRGPRPRALGAGLCVWLAELEPALRRRSLERLSLRGDLSDRILGFPRQRDAWLRGLGRSRGRGAIDALLHGIDEERLFALHASAPAPLARRIVRWAAEDRSRRLPVTGRDLVELGLEGPVVGRALARIRAATLDGELANREEALALAREVARRRRGGRKSAGPPS